MNKNFLFTSQYAFHNSRTVKLICNLYENYIYRNINLSCYEINICQLRNFLLES